MPTPLIARLRREIERELQAIAASGAPLDAAAHRDALARALARIRSRRGREWRAVSGEQRRASMSSQLRAAHPQPLTAHH